MYVLIAVAGWHTWEAEKAIPAKALWAGQMALNFVWSPLFFTVHSLGGALFVIVALLIAIVLFIAPQWSRDRLAALLFAPYAASVGFASALNASILLLNR